MNNTKFISFLESLKTPDTEILINAIMEGWDALADKTPSMEVIAIGSDGKRKTFPNYYQAKDYLKRQLGFVEEYMPGLTKSWAQGGTDDKIPVLFFKRGSDLKIRVYPLYVIEDGLVTEP